jgi:polar amino acid transport system ATP-binding protein/sulfate transport system ATP-binding protein
MTACVGYEYSFGKTLLEVKDLNVSYPDENGNMIPILKNLNFNILNISRPGRAQGQVDALLSPSGMGKTTLFRCISGLNRINSGSILINPNGDDNMIPARTGLVGVVAQDYPLFNHLTVLDNLMIAAKIKNKDHSAAKKDVLEFLDRFLLSDKAHLYPYQLSGGQKQRVAIIQQMVCDNHLLLMDEPFSGLDIIMKTEVQNLISTVASQNDLNSVIVTTHDIQSAIAVADTILLLGRERDALGNMIPGAMIKYTYNLMELGLAWRPNIAEMPEFSELEREIKARFKEL